MIVLYEVFLAQVALLAEPGGSRNITSTFSGPLVIKLDPLALPPKIIALYGVEPGPGNQFTLRVPTFACVKNVACIVLVKSVDASKLGNATRKSYSPKPPTTLTEVFFRLTAVKSFTISKIPSNGALRITEGNTSRFSYSS